MNHPYRDPVSAGHLVLSFKERILKVVRIVTTAPGRWWSDLSDAYRALTVLAFVVAVFAAIISTLVHADPCAKHIMAKVHGVTPEGLPADYDQSWCAEYKSGRGP